MTKPPQTLSIITVVKDDPIGLFKTAQSVKEQREVFPSIEHVIIDGASGKETQAVLSEVGQSADIVRSEPDSGIYDAMNKGIDRSSGEALLFLNAGDVFVGPVLQNLTQVPSFLPVKYVDFFGRLKDRPIVHHWTGIPNCHQGIVFERTDVRYDLQYAIASDYDYFLRHGYTWRLNRTPSDAGYILFDNAGVNTQKVTQRDREIRAIRTNHFGPVIGNMFELKPFAKRIVRKCLGRLT
ncbi:MAG: glycosyltransferase [Spirochaetaceae bacterium]